MGAYIVRRLLLMIPTLLAIMVINFVVIQVAPGGPVEQVISQLTGIGSDITERVTRTGTSETLTPSASRQAQGNTAVRRAWTRTSSRRWRNSSALISHCTCVLFS